MDEATVALLADAISELRPELENDPHWLAELLQRCAIYSPEITVAEFCEAICRSQEQDAEGAGHRVNGPSTIQ